MRYPPPSAILSRKGIAQYGAVSRTGPLRVRAAKHGSRLCSVCVCAHVYSDLSDKEHGLSGKVSKQLVRAFETLPKIRLFPALSQARTSTRNLVITEAG